MKKDNRTNELIEEIQNSGLKGIDALVAFENGRETIEQERNMQRSRSRRKAMLKAYAIVAAGLIGGGILGHYIYDAPGSGRDAETQGYGQGIQQQDYCDRD